MLCVECSGLLGDGEGEAEDHEAEDQRDAAEHPRDDVDLLLQLLLRGLQQGLQVYSLYKGLQRFTKVYKLTPHLLVCPDQRQQGEQDQARQPRHVERPPSLRSPVTVCNPESGTIMTLIISPHT